MSINVAQGRGRSARHMGRQAQRGLGLLEVLLFVFVLSGMVLAGYLGWRERTALQTARTEKSTLSQADQAVITFATVMRRLPCPDTDRDGSEDCGANAQKGWLPSTTLRLAGADPGVAIGQLHYLVQRGTTDIDLAMLSDSWRPLEYDDAVPTFAAMRDTTASGGTYQADILTLPDLCQRLGEGTGATFSTALAHVTSSPERPVAYALVHPGLADEDGDGSLFDGVNPDAVNAFDDPNRSPLLGGYDDLVLERSFTSLQAAFSCQPLAQSIDSLALGLDVVDQVDQMREDNIDAAERAVIFAALGAAITAVELTASIVEAASDAGNAAADAALCGASLGLAVNACAAIGPHIGGAVAAGITTGFNIASIALNVTAAALAGNALVLADNSRPPSSVACPVPNVADALARAQADRDDAVADLAQLQTDLANAQARLATANTARTNAINSLYAAIRNGTGSAQIDDRVPPLIAAAGDYVARQRAYDEAAADVNNYQTLVTNWSATVADYDAMLATRTTRIPVLQAEITALDTQIAATTDPVARDALIATRTEKSGELLLLQDLTTLNNERNNAITERDTASANLAAAQTALALAGPALTAARNQYQTTYSNIVNVTQYSFGPLNAFVACNPALVNPCPNGSVNTAPAVQAAMTALLGASGNTGSVQPQTTSRFVSPYTIQSEIDGIQAELNSAGDRVTRAQDLYDDVLAQSQNPPSCTVTGSGVTPWSPAAAGDILVNTDIKGGTR
ncbi:hypothetical protein [Hydrogenophaga sp.]|uniref:hypothetical protein n=1 Tax=Hydrogenophaga sp. TaxID=1904254 RepID=UPI0025B899D5|nr:hypothetical protein [Hydrogenophaga sp.]